MGSIEIEKGYVMNLRSQEYLAKLLAKENLSVQHGNYSTASFDVEKRILRLPLWEDKGKHVYDLLVGHEVGHALYTPLEGLHDAIDNTDIPKAFLNIVEDIRIERKIMETYPGIKKAFVHGYKRLFDDDLFGTNEREVTSLMDRLNVHAKGRGIVPIEFDSEEQPLINEAMRVETWDDVKVVCQKLKDFLDEKKEESDEEESSDSNPTDGEGETSEVPNDDSNSENSDSSDEPMEPMSESDWYREMAKGAGENEDSTEEENDDDDDDYGTFTDETFREREEDLLEGEDDRYGRTKVQAKYSNGISKENIKKVIVPWKTLVEARNNLEYDKEGYLFDERLDTRWAKVSKTLDSTANLLAKDFERKKAAYEYQRATTAKKGSLNVNKLYQYKYSEDIFLTIDKLAQAKSHGIVMFVDFSGSMQDIIEDVVKQTLTIAMFCKKVNIPFEVYTFTSKFNRHWRDNDNPKLGVSGNDIDNLDSLNIVEVLSSTMKKIDFKKASRDFYCSVGLWDRFEYTHENGHKRHIFTDTHNVTSYDCMGSTPLIQTVIIAGEIVSDFNRRYGIQKTNIMILTDGCADSLYISDDDYERSDVRTSGRKWAVNFAGKMVRGDGTADLYENCLGRLRELTGAKITGFFLANGVRDWYYAMPEYKTSAEEKKKWQKNFVTDFKNEKGYDDYFIVKVGNTKVEEVFEPKKTEKISDIRNEFKKFNRSKKVTKQLVNKISDAVAA